MQNLVNKNIDSWVRPWNKEKFDDLTERDERFFSLVIKGALGWLTRNIVLYNKPIKHFIFNTGSSILYMESNGYEFKEQETTGENWMYMNTPCCLCEFGNFTIQTDDLSSQYVRGTYERKSNKDGQIHGYNAEIRRLPIEIDLKCHYELSTMNEGFILCEELFSKLVFQKYYKIVYLGNIITCSIEFPTNGQIQFEKIDLANPQNKNKHIELDLKITTAYPQIDIRSESDNANIISKFGLDMNLYRDLTRDASDIIKKKYK